MKYSLQALPLYGFYFYEHGCIYVKRGSFKPRKMLQALDYLKHPKIKVRKMSVTNSQSRDLENGREDHLVLGSMLRPPCEEKF